MSERQLAKLFLSPSILSAYLRITEMLYITQTVVLQWYIRVNEIT